MALPFEKMAELRVKHLEMLQALVSRMGGYGISLKGLCVTLTTGVCGFGIALHRPLVTLLAVFPVIAFALLDAQCLRVERRFRLLYDVIRRETWDTMPSFEINLAIAPRVRRRDVVASWSIAGFYTPLAIGVVTIAGIGNVHASL
jgi:hypothetical protein